MTKNVFIKSLTSGLVLSCCASSQFASAMENAEQAKMTITAPMKIHQQFMVSPEQHQKFSNIPMQQIIERAYGGDEDCRIYLMTKIYYGHIDEKTLNIKVNELLRLDHGLRSIETLSPIEYHLIFTSNPDNILSSDIGISLIADLQERAEKDPVAQSTLAHLYNQGITDTLDKDLNKFVKLLIESTNQGFAPAQTALALAYMSIIPTGLGKDLNKAIDLFIKSANQGEVMAQYCLAGLYSREERFKEIAENDPTFNLAINYPKAIELYTKSADRGFTIAQYSLGTLYENGIPEFLDKNIARAIELYIQAHDNGLPPTEASIKNLKEIFSISPKSPLTKDIITMEKQEIHDLAFITEQILGPLSTWKKINNPDGFANTMMAEKGIAIPSLYKHYKECSDYSEDILSILGHLHSEGGMAQGFLVSCIGLKESKYAADIIQYCTGPEATLMHMVKNHNTEETFFTFGNSDKNTDALKNIQYSKMVEEIINPNSPRNQKLDKAIALLSKLYTKKIDSLEQNIENLMLRAMDGQDDIIQNSSALSQPKSNKNLLENADQKTAALSKNMLTLTDQLAELKKRLKKDKTILERLEKIDVVKKKLLEIIFDSPALRDETFKNNSKLGCLLTK